MTTLRFQMGVVGHKLGVKHLYIYICADQLKKLLGAGLMYFTYSSYRLSLHSLHHRIAARIVKIPNNTNFTLHL